MQNPAWNLDSEYPGFDSVEFQNELAKVESLRLEILAHVRDIQSLFNRAAELSAIEYKNLVSQLQILTEMGDAALIPLYNLSTYTSCHLSVDTTSKDAQKAYSQISKLKVQLEEATKPVTLFLTRASEGLFNDYLQHPFTKTHKFTFTQKRLNQNWMLPENEELLLTALREPGLKAWGDLYNKLSGTVQCTVEIDGQKESLGLGQAHSLLFHPLDQKREAAFRGLQEVWTTHQESAAAILNGLAQFRLEECKKRSHTQKVHFLSLPLHQNGIQNKTLEAMLSVCESSAPVIREALTAMARFRGKEKLAPWDLNAPAPAVKMEEISFHQAIEIIRTAMSEFNPDFGHFVQMMADNQWIEARILPTKSPGAYCTSFVKSNTPRVFQTYTGTQKDLVTLAHELGHAYHAWVMRDIPLAESGYSMSLAETASIFAEATLADYLKKTAQTEHEIFNVAWRNASDAIGFLLNIPARFEFERSFYEKRESGFCSPQELSELTNKAWRKWYGDTLSEPDSLFWAHKLHFSIAGRSFYNFPYTFGYLFSLSIYARKEKFGADFKNKYIEILRDTGRMTAEDLVKKHLQEDITQPSFWQKSMDVVTQKVQHFISLV